MTTIAKVRAMKRDAVTFVFGRRSYIHEGYSSDGGSPDDPFVFTISVDGCPSSWKSAYALLGFFREEFITACKASGTSSALRTFADFEIVIPTYYLDRPTIKVGESELLLDGEKPNPWLSRT